MICQSACIIVIGRLAHILQDTTSPDTELHTVTLTFMSSLFVEEGKLLAHIARNEVDIDYTVRDRLDMPPKAGTVQNPSFKNSNLRYFLPFREISYMYILILIYCHANGT